MQALNTYRPSLRRMSKWSKYAQYLLYYIMDFNWRSIIASVRYTITQRLPKKRYKVYSHMGIYWIRTNSTDFQFINKAYETAIKNYIEANLNKITHFIDIGACIGEYCIWLSKMGIKTYAIEPINHEAIEDNIRLNKDVWINKPMVFPVAIGSRNGLTNFCVPNGSPGASHRSDSGEESVVVRTIDSLFEANMVPAGTNVLIKLDIEGMEAEAIEGGMHFLRALKNVAIIYEQFDGDTKTDEMIRRTGNYTISNLDKVNRIAVKVDKIAIKLNQLQ